MKKRNRFSILNKKHNGDFISSDTEYPLSKFRLRKIGSNYVKSLHLETVKFPSSNNKIKVELDPDGPSGPAGYIAYDTVKIATLKVELRSNTDNHVEFTDKFGDKWPTQSPFESSPAERKYQKEGKPLLIAVNDDYTEKQKKNGKWVKDNIAGDNGHKIVAGDKSLQDGKIIFPADLKGDKITLTFSSKIKVWWKIPDASKWTEIPKEDTTEFKKFTNGEIPIKIEGISPGTGIIKFSFVKNKNTITDSLNFKVVPTLRMVACYGKLENKYDAPIKNLRRSLKTRFNIFNKVAPKGRFEAKLTKASRKIVNICAKNQWPSKSPKYRYPRYWNHLFLFAHGGVPVFMDNSNGKWIEKDGKRFPRDPSKILVNSDKYYRIIEKLREYGSKIQNGHNLSYFKKANKKKKELQNLKRKPGFNSYVPVSYLSFNLGGYWPRQLLARVPGLKTLSLSCWDWWAGGAGKSGQTDCVTVARKGKKIVVITKGKKAEGSPFPLWTGTVVQPTLDHIVGLFKKEIK